MSASAIKTQKTKVRLPRSIKRLFPQVTSAVDAAKAVEVSVSRKDCKGAQKKNPMECALARAARRELHVDGAIIGISSSYIIKGNQAIRFSTPEHVRREIVSFDRHQDFNPGDYTLVPKAPTAKLGESRRGKSTNEDKTVKRRVHRETARIRILPGGTAKE